MNTIFVLLSPLWLSWKNDFRRAGNQWGRRLFLLGLALAFWCGTFFVIRRVLIYFQSVYELGPALAYQLLLIILLTFLSMLLFSNLVTSLSTFFLARDLDLVLSTPIPIGSFYYSRLITTTVNSSWMVLFFSLPIFVAYGSVFGGGMPFYLWVLVIVPLFLTIPASLGILITHLLVYCLPARRIRDILLFIGLFAFVGIYFLFRFSQPERLVQPESFGNFIQSWPPWKLRRHRFCRAAGPLRSWPGAFSIGRSNKGSFTPYSPAMRYFSLSLLPGSLAPSTSPDGPRRKNRDRADGEANGSIVLWKG